MASHDRDVSRCVTQPEMLSDHPVHPMEASAYKHDPRGEKN